MRSSTGRWVSGEDFFDREPELRLLESRVRDGNHVLLTGQRRMGKTSVARELGRRLETQGWVFLFTDVEGATSEKDVIAGLANAVQPVRPILSRFTGTMRRWLGEQVEKVDEISASDFRVKFRTGLRAGNWRYRGEQLIHACAAHDQPVLLVIDELPIFLTKMLRNDNGARRVDDFLSWLRGMLQGLGGSSPVLIVSGSIGLAPLVRRLGIPDRINHLHPFRLGPWSREISVECFERLAKDNGLQIEHGVADTVYEALGTGIPHYVQSFFAHLQEFSAMRNRDLVTVEDVGEIYRSELLGPSEDNDLVHYQTRLKEGLDDERSYTIAMEILAEAATQDAFTPEARRCLARRCLARLYSPVGDDVPDRIAEVLGVLVHDGYLETGENGHRFPFRLLKDWWFARFRDHHIPLGGRFSDEDRGGLQ